MVLLAGELGSVGAGAMALDYWQYGWPVRGAIHAPARHGPVRSVMYVPPGPGYGVRAQ